MNYSDIVGWGRYLPPLRVSNEDLTHFVDTSDAWIQSRTGIESRRYSHVSTGEMGWLAAERALATADMSGREIDLVILGSTTSDEVCPNTASFIKNKLGAIKAAAFDLNSACTSWLYGLVIATDMISAGTINNAVVVGSERLSIAMDWNKRESCCLFGDGAGAVVLRKSDKEVGLLKSKISCVPDSRDCLKIPRWGIQPAVHTGQLHLSLDFDGSAIFKRAVNAMAHDCKHVMQEAGISVDDIDLFVPHQANIRIINALGGKLKIPSGKTIVTIDRYANTSAASIPIALCEALENGLIRPNQKILMASFGAGLSCGAVLVRWGERISCVEESEHSIPEYYGDVKKLLCDSFLYHGVEYR